ncbi:MAG: cysteine--tRNA ligase [Sulfurimonadaceae bacterium]|nr:cysteine--tRNA ligase [Sulfurimonadaceae bacterium]
MYIFDSVKKQKLKFTPQNPPKVTMYVCGPTVYDDAHLGHAKSALVFDLLHRVLEANGYEVTYAKNITDIDDKIIKRALELNISTQELAQKYTKAYHDEMSKLGVKRADLEPKATENLEAIFDLIKKLLEKNHAYRVSSCDIYFDTASDSKYLSLSHRVQNEEDKKQRVEGDKEKKNSADFALWKIAKDDEVSFDSPFGAGRPGWHIECSAMIDEHLADKNSEFAIDIHGGGADLLFPHHENEAAQSRCATGQNLAAYWVHNGFVTINNEKMSKSLGNSFFLKDALKHYDGEVLRFYLLSVHYRANFNFSYEDLDEAKKRLDKLYRLKKRVFNLSFESKKTEFKDRLLEALNDDLNISEALAIVDEMINSSNEALDKKDKTIKDELLSNLEFVEKLLGFGGQNPYEYFQHGISDEQKTKIDELIAKRVEAKKAKDFTLADAIRDELSALGIAIMDTPDGTFWERA